MEEAVRLIEANGGEVTVLTLGPVEAEEQLRYAASASAVRCGSQSTSVIGTKIKWWAPTLAGAVADVEAVVGPFDLVLFGNESADAGGFQVGVRVAYALGRPVVNGIKGIDVADGVASARRQIDGGFEVYNVPLPAVRGGKEGINLPRYPTMKGRLASKKAEVVVDERSAGAGGQERVRLHRPVETVSETVILGTGPEAAPAIVDLLEELGVLS